MFPDLMSPLKFKLFGANSSEIKELKFGEIAVDDTGIEWVNVGDHVEQIGTIPTKVSDLTNNTITVNRGNTSNTGNTTWLSSGNTGNTTWLSSGNTGNTTWQGSTTVNIPASPWTWVDPHTLYGWNNDSIFEKTKRRFNESLYDEKSSYEIEEYYKDLYRRIS